MTSFPAILRAPALALTALLACSGAANAQDGRMLFAHLDANGDGFVELDELSAQRARSFERLDRDADDMLSPAEIEAARARIRLAAAMADAMARNADLNGDGALSRAEFIERPTPMLSLADVDGDGRVSFVEFRDAVESLRGRR